MKEINELELPAGCRYTEDRENPERLHQEPLSPKVKRLDETLAARKLCLCG